MIFKVLLEFDYINTNFTDARYDKNGLDYSFSGLVLVASLEPGVAIK